MTKTLHIVFDKFPDHDGARFIEVEDGSGRSVNAGEWRKRDDGFVELVIEVPDINNDRLTTHLT